MIQCQVRAASERVDNPLCIISHVVMRGLQVNGKKPLGASVWIGEIKWYSISMVRAATIVVEVTVGVN